LTCYDGFALILIWSAGAGWSLADGFGWIKPSDGPFNLFSRTTRYTVWGLMIVCGSGTSAFGRF